MADKYELGLRSIIDSPLFIRAEDIWGDNIIIKTISGNNNSLNVADAQAGIWGLSIPFTFLDGNTQLYISSSSASDTSCLVLIEYVDEDNFPHSTFVTTNGQTPVALGVTDTWSVNLGTCVAGATNIGDIYVHTNVSGVTNGIPDDLSEVDSFIDAGTNRSHQARFAMYEGYKTFNMSTTISGSTTSLQQQADRTRIATQTNFRLSDDIILCTTTNNIGAGNGIITSIPSTGASINGSSGRVLFYTASTNLDDAQIAYTFTLIMIKDSFFDKINASFGFEKNLMI